MSPLTVIVGLGKTGLSCVRYLIEQGLNVAVTDSREQPPGLEELKQDFPNIPLKLGKIDENLCLNAQQLIVSPGISLREPAIANAISAGIPAIGDIELFVRQANAPIIAITGSNGKSTVTTLVGEMAKQANWQVRVGGNIGVPALELLNDSEPALYVLELSSFQLETTYSLHTKAAVILNISEDHMDRYENMQSYIQAKQRIYQNCDNPIINRNDLQTVANLNLKNPLSYGLDEPTGKNFGIREHQGKNYLAKDEQLLIAVDEIKIKGRHQQANALAALALGSAAGLPMEAMIDTLKIFPGLAHRCQWIRNYNGVDWYNDSKATNVGAALASIEGIGATLAGKVLLIAGGIGKNADFLPLREAVSRYVRSLILIGQDAAIIANTLQGCTTIHHAANLVEASSIAQQQAQMGDAVLLAPACASFDMFKNFEHRGETFINVVRSLS